METAKKGKSANKVERIVGKQVGVELETPKNFGEKESAHQMSGNTKHLKEMVEQRRL